MEDFGTFQKRARTAFDTSLAASDYQTYPMLTTIAQLQPFDNKTWSDQIDILSMVFTRSVFQDSGNSKKNYNHSLVHALNLTALNYVLHQKTRAIADSGDKTEMWEYAKTWTPRCVCLTPAADQMNLPLVRDRDITIQIRGVTDVVNLWGSNVKSGDTCYFKLEWETCKANETTTYTLCEGNSIKVEAYRNQYDYPKFKACFTSIPRFDFDKSKRVYYRIGIAMNHAKSDGRFVLPEKEKESENTVSNDDATAALGQPRLVLMLN